MEIEDIKKLGVELMKSSKAVYLTTINFDGYPITRAMFNLRNEKQFPEFSDFYKKLENQFEIYFSTNTSSSKTAHIKENPKISVYYCDPEDFKGIMFGGNVEIIEDITMKKKIWLDWWTKYYREGVEDPDYTLLRLKPRKAEFYYKLQKAEFEIGEK